MQRRDICTHSWDRQGDLPDALRDDGDLSAGIPDDGTDFRCASHGEHKRYAVSILSTKITFDNNEKTTTTATTPAVVSDTALADDAEITIDIDVVGTSGAEGLKVTLLGTR